MARYHKIDWTLHGEEIKQLYIDGLSVREIIREINKRHGVTYNSGTLTNYIGKNGLSRTQSDAHKLIRKKHTRTCESCKQSFNTTSYRQKWCDVCSGNGKYKKRLMYYGLTAPELEKMLKDQGNNCKICGRHFDVVFGKGQDRRRTLLIDHDHDTGRVRGLVCTRCNLGLSFIDDKSGWLDRALHYVQESTGTSSQADTNDT